MPYTKILSKILLVKDLIYLLESPKLVLLKFREMRTIQKSPISPFGGLNFVLEEAVELKVNKLLENQLPILPPQSTYNWFDIFMSYWSVFFAEVIALKI